MYRSVQCEHRQHDRPDMLTSEAYAVFRTTNAGQGPKNDNCTGVPDLSYITEPCYHRTAVLQFDVLAILRCLHISLRPSILVTNRTLELFTSLLKPFLPTEPPRQCFVLFRLTLLWVPCKFTISVESESGQRSDAFHRTFGICLYILHLMINQNFSNGQATNSHSHLRYEVLVLDHEPTGLRSGCRSDCCRDNCRSSFTS